MVLDTIEKCVNIRKKKDSKIINYFMILPHKNVDYI